MLPKVKICAFAAVGLCAWAASASWYWPFSSETAGTQERRLSELMEKASEYIDEASDLAADGKTSEAVEKYREVLLELDRIEAENPERVKRQEFSTVRNKRAYVNAAIDALLMAQARGHAKPVTVSDTTELERRLRAEKDKKSGVRAKKSVKTVSKEGKSDAAVGKSGSERAKKREAKPETARPTVAETAKAAPKPVAKAVEPPAPPLSRRELAIQDIERRDWDAAKLSISEMLVETPNDPVALNLMAAMEAARGDFKAAESALDQAIQAHPRDYHAYYNLALLTLQRNPGGKTLARQYYETGRRMGGPVHPELEGLSK